METNTPYGFDDPALEISKKRPPIKDYEKEFHDKMESEIYDNQQQYKDFMKNRGDYAR